ncbi:hypothetical protein LXL04_003331 [Taraxacum kok-saghyz]
MNQVPTLAYLNSDLQRWCGDEGVGFPFSSLLKNCVKLERTSTVWDYLVHKIRYYFTPEWVYDQKKFTSDIDSGKSIRKGKKKQEKALATSANISDLEKKKLRKGEKQRLDEEGVAIDEAVVLQVLIGEEDSDNDDGFYRNGNEEKH